MEMDYTSTSHQMAPTILVQHFKTLLPGLKSYISTVLVTAAKEHASYGEIMESKAGMGALHMNILSKYIEDIVA